MAGKPEQTIVIRRVKKVVGGGHHGGAWKVAFADFVTAMMAFFLVLWLVSTASKETRAAVADYFNNPMGGAGPSIPTPGGIGPGGASTSMIERGGTMDPATARTVDEKTLEQLAEEQEREKLEELRKELEAAVEKSQALAPFKDQLLIDISEEGLRIQIVDKLGRPMFDSGSAQLKPYAAAILRELAGFLNDADQGISIAGHTDATQYASQNGFSNWELASERANAARRELVATGLRSDKMVKVLGLADSVPLDRNNPQNPMNRRISIVVMRNDAVKAVREEAETNAETAAGAS